MKLLDVQDLEKRYPTFTLDKVSFSLEPGYIMGFIGRNGAGKTTTMKAMLNLIHRVISTNTLPTTTIGITIPSRFFLVSILPDISRQYKTKQNKTGDGSLS